MFGFLYNMVNVMQLLWWLRKPLIARIRYRIDDDRTSSYFQLLFNAGLLAKKMQKCISFTH